MKKILLLSKYTRMGARSRLRTIQYIPYLERNGYKVTQQSLFDDDYLKSLYLKNKTSKLHVFSLFIKRIYTLLKVKKFDLLWIEKELFPYFPAWFEFFLKKIGIKYIVDYDDAIFHNYDLSNNKIIKSVLGNKIDLVMKNSALVIAGNNYLAERAKIAGVNNIHIIPTVVDRERYTESYKKNDIILVG